jgi:hypothetical protein
VAAIVVAVLVTWQARAVALFPAAIVAGALASIGWLVSAPGPLPALALAALLYVVPVAAFRAHEALWPMKRGATHLGGRRYVPWWGAHQTQLIYIALPQLEALLRLVPGLYSAWLRLWGARVGKHVHWTPLVDIGDRSLVEIGDDVIFGHRATLYAHVISPTKTNLVLYVKPIRIEDRAFVGAGAVLGPGARVTAGKLVAAGTHVYPNQEIE